VQDVNASLITTGGLPIMKTELKGKRYAKSKLKKTDGTFQKKTKTGYLLES
jgi:hypothetical protein